MEPPPPPPPTTSQHGLIAAIDLGTKSFKLLLARAFPRGRLLALARLKEPVLLGRGRAADGSLTHEACLRAIAALRSFSLALRPLRVSLIRAVATAAIRSAPNRDDLLSAVRSVLQFQVDVLSGEDEARLIYLGVLQFLPVFERTILVVDIGGGSTEFVVGNEGKVLFATSLNLGHISLTEFHEQNGKLEDLRSYIRAVLDQSPLVEKVRELGFEIAIGSSGTIRSIERAIFLDGYGESMSRDFVREWKFSKEELVSLVEKLTSGDLSEIEATLRFRFSKRRREFIVAGAILLLELFEALGINNIEVSGYALSEGVISEMLANNHLDYDMSANARWRSVVSIATRFDGDDRMKSAANCVGIAKDLFDGIVRLDDHVDDQVHLHETDFEYIEAALLLHNIGLLMGKKGYHKRSYKIIKNCGHLHGYSSEEIELVALLARFHRKKFPKSTNDFLEELPFEMKQKFRALCVIMRISVTLQKCQCVTSHVLEVLPTEEGFQLVIGSLKDHLQVSHGIQLTLAVIEAELRPELNHFEEVFQRKMTMLLS
ncbi:hypothetical protein Cni_G11995 [Canna indica]|uniref:Exopolyphosphatase n=1 Tax=Canna indica TaxID=4628 RepID=A0AAQ3K8Y6_9LILI|nr:hypothetical protein Cni_G11995 [Canna indica]